MLLQRRRSCVRQDEQSCLSREPRSAQGPKETREGDEEGSQEAEEGAGQDVQGKSEEDPLPEAQLLKQILRVPRPCRDFGDRAGFLISDSRDRKSTSPPCPCGNPQGQEWGTPYFLCIWLCDAAAACYYVQTVACTDTPSQSLSKKSAAVVFSNCYQTSSSSAPFLSSGVAAVTLDGCRESWRPEFCCCLWRREPCGCSPLLVPAS